jgi:hypothetical protein
VPTFDNSGSLAYGAPQNWHGTCETGEGFTVAHCNNKLIGARFFKDGFNQTSTCTGPTSSRRAIPSAAPWAMAATAPTSSTAAGNNNVPAG